MAHYSKTLFHVFMDNFLSQHWSKMPNALHRLIAKHLLIMAMEDDGSDPDLWIPNRLLDDFEDDDREDETIKKVGFSKDQYKNFLLAYNFPVSKGPFFYFILDCGENGLIPIRTMFPLPIVGEQRGEYLRKPNGDEAYYETFIMLNPEKEPKIVNFIERVICDIEYDELEKEEIRKRQQDMGEYDELGK